MNPRYSRLPSGGFFPLDLCEPSEHIEELPGLFIRQIPDGVWAAAEDVKLNVQIIKEDGC
ncbi:MAG: hypothetical protein JW986_04835 [Methanotrichaceae archaeon]|nr:hypothetical protein [Methanotrichaceae archaeon]